METIDAIVEMAALIFFAFTAGASASLALAYAFLPLAKRIMRFHVVMLSISYAGFVSAPCLHALHAWPHDCQSTNAIEHFGIIGWLWLVLCACLGIAGIAGALTVLATRVRVVAANGNGGGVERPIP